MMLRTRYPYPDAGRVAGLIFAAAALVIGIIVAEQLVGGTAAIVDTAVWSVMAGLVAYLVFASQGPTRPESVRQACAADGVVSGIVAGGLGGLFGILLASGVGTNVSNIPSAGQMALAMVASLIGGGVTGALLGLMAYLAGGSSRFARVPPKAGRRHAGSRARARRR
ncbi:MAG TPA: hypothetical protein VKX16_13315 [Chloroflexota bacterium]|nr:hypothetical protein [Chloroflexota bacterium]